MKYYWLFFLLLCSNIVFGQINYEQHFSENALRIDFLLAGDSEQEEIYLQQLKKEKPWAGTTDQLITPFKYGNYAIEAKNKNGKIIYFRGFSTLFEEWITTKQAKNMKKAFQQTIRIPFPKEKVTIKIQKRDFNSGAFNTILKREIDPVNNFIISEDPEVVNYTTIQDNGDPSSNVDIAFISEGYRKKNMAKFRADAKNITNYIFNQKPFNKHKENFNIYAVEAISKEQGTDEPDEGIYRNTALNSSFNTFNSPRYLTSTDTWRIRDIAAVVPYDHIIILTNTTRYGGGGFYNHLSISSVDHQYSKEVLIHEFGHGFAGLGDEYYNSEVAYSEYYNLNIEPWEPNITTRTDFSSKWADLIKEDTPVPTPREPKYSDKIGLFEGGGYLAEGIYSPYMNCRMKSNISSGFCPVCQNAIEDMILYYTGEL